MSPSLSAPTIEDIHSARKRIADAALRTPLVPLGGNPDARIWLKLESLQPIGSFKIRGASNAMALAGDRLADGVYTASAGNMAQGVAWNARRLGVPCTVVVPDHAPQAKLDAVRALGADIVAVPFEEWWQVMVDHHYPGLPGAFVHPVCDSRVMAGNGTIGLEILDDLPDVDEVIIPFGGGGLSCGIATAIRAQRPRVRIHAAEVETAAPLAASLAAGAPQSVDYTASFVDGIGSTGLLPGMWPLIQSLIDDSLVVPLDAVREAIRLLVRQHRIVAEGAGAASLAAVEAAGDGKIVCVISGGNINPGVVSEILASA